MPKQLRIHGQQSDKIIPLTQQAYDDYQKEFDRLTKLREEVIIRLQAAREMGDLSENGAYHAAKFELGSIGRQLKHLTKMLQYGKVIKIAHTGSANFGNTITLESASKKLTFMLVSDFESDPSKQKLSTKSPIGAAVVGKKVGDEIEVQTPQGISQYTILSIQ